MAEQTSVEWLVKKLEENGIPLMKDELEMVEQANQMFKKQIIETWKHGNLPTFLGRVLTAEEYYNETFKSQ
jgi:hypothetical protein